jgi:hypothetical protein
MYFTQELGIRLSFVKTSEFQGGVDSPPRYATGHGWLGNEWKIIFMQDNQCHYLTYQWAKSEMDGRINRHW